MGCKQEKGLKLAGAVADGTCQQKRGVVSRRGQVVQRTMARHLLCYLSHDKVHGERGGTLLMHESIRTGLAHPKVDGSI